MTDAEIWEQRYLLTEQKYARLYLSVIDSEFERFQARMAARYAEAATQDAAAVTPPNTDRQG